jgi:predicted nucleotidyltransferase
MITPSHSPVAPDPAALRAAVRPVAERHRWRLVVLFGSVARDGHGRDLDLAVLPRVQPDLLAQGCWWSDLDAVLAGTPLDLLVLGPATSPLTLFEVMREGRVLFEDTPGLFDQEQDRAVFLYADTQWIRDQQREVLYARAQH